MTGRYGARTFVLARMVLVLVPALVLGAAARQQPTFRSSAETILVPVWVTDRNKPVAGLSVADFELLDEGVTQAPSLITGEATPLDVTLMLDTSGSLAGKALDQLTADVQEIAQLLKPADRLRLLTFGRDVTDVFGLQPGGARVSIEHIAGGGVTSFYNALAASLILPAADRPQLVFGFTDGRDDASFLDVGQIVSLAERSSASLYLAVVPSNDSVIDLNAQNGGNPMANEHNVVTSAGHVIAYRSVGPYRGGPNISALKSAAARTGGAVYENPPNAKLPGMFTRVLDDFRSSYVLAFTPSGVPKPGWHELTVRMKNTKLTVRARKGYDGG